MQNRGRKRLVSSIAICEIFLLVCASFAIAFILNSKDVGIVSAENGDTQSTRVREGEPVMKDTSSAPVGNRAAPTSLTGWKAVSAVPKDATVRIFEGNFQLAKEGESLDLVGYRQVIDKTGKSTFEGMTADGKLVPGLAETEIKGSGVPFKEVTPEGPSFISKLFGLKGETLVSGPGGALIAGAAWALVAYGAIKILGKALGLRENLVNSLSLSAAGGLFAWRTVSLLAKGDTFGSYAATLGKAAPFIGLGVGAAIFILTYKTEKKKIVTFECLPWEAPIGGTNCEECNKDPFRPCSDYRCRALGQACQLLNPGTAEENCAWVNPKDVNSPILTPSEPLTNGLRYVPDTAIRPPALGVKVVRSSASDGCLQAFTPLEFSVTTNEPAQCKVDYVHTGSFDNMTYFLGESNYFAYNHTQKMRLPGLDTGEEGDLAPVIENDGSYSLYVRCKDANGNENVDEYSFSFCVDKGPDTTPPVIEGTSIVDGSPVQFNVDAVPIEVYVNEPSECKWSRQDKAYSDMENSMRCATKTYQINANLAYTCSGNLTGIKNSEDNKFYFRCKDQPSKPESERIENSQSFPLTLKGTQALNIIKVEPNGTIYGSTTTVSVDLALETSNGALDGKAKCYFSPSGDIDSYVAMFETDNYVHKQTLDLTAGAYRYYFRCIDDGGNSDDDSTGFNVFVDKSAPMITRIYKESDALKIVTNEDAECVYSINSCNYNFEEGLKFSYFNPEDKTAELAEWKPSVVYYIKCQDAYGNMPVSNSCTMEASATQLSG